MNIFYDKKSCIENKTLKLSVYPENIWERVLLRSMEKGKDDRFRSLVKKYELNIEKLESQDDSIIKSLIIEFILQELNIKVFDESEKEEEENESKN